MSKCDHLEWGLAVKARADTIRAKRGGMGDFVIDSRHGKVALIAVHEPWGVVV